jgi:hypothetical protein
VLKRRRRTLMRQHKYRRPHRRCCCVRKGGLGAHRLNICESRRPRCRSAAGMEAWLATQLHSELAAAPPEQPGRGEVALPLGGLARCASHRRQCVC